MKSNLDGICYGVIILIYLFSTVQASDTLFHDDFNDLSAYKLFGNPLPVLSENTKSDTGTSFDNNGDANYASGAVLRNYSFNMNPESKTRISAYVYVTHNPDGCWITQTINLGKDSSNLSSTTNPDRMLTFGINDIGSLCWASPESEQGKTKIFLNFITDDDTRAVWDTIVEPHMITNKWIYLELVIDENAQVSLYKNGSILWLSHKKIIQISMDHLFG